MLTSYVDVPTDPFRLSSELSRTGSQALASHGYQLAHCGPERLTWRRERRPTWAKVLAVLLFPIGLVFLLARDIDDITLDLVPTDEGTRVRCPDATPLALTDAIGAVRGSTASDTMRTAAPSLWAPPASSS